uniref:Neugrin n=1 Tax=Cyprinus carpio TaxID=7962 RepID=A0A8C2IUY0_CYPCA
MSLRYSDSHPRQKQQEDMFEDDHDIDAVEAKLKSIISEERRRRKAAKFHIIKMEMNNPGAPERRLSWDTIQQIRYQCEYVCLLQPVRKLKQDSKVLASTGPQSLREGKTEQTRLPKSATPAILLSGNTGALTAPSTGALAAREAETGLVSSSGNIVPSQLSAEQKVTPALQEQPDCKAEMDMRGDIELEEEWDGVILTEEELEHIKPTLKEKPSPVEQKGKEFFDSEGKFLYSI